VTKARAKPPAAPPAPVPVEPPPAGRRAPSTSMLAAAASPGKAWQWPVARRQAAIWAARAACRTLAALEGSPSGRWRRS
jgi:hypothetical protein